MNDAKIFLERKGDELQIVVHGNAVALCKMLINLCEQSPEFFIVLKSTLDYMQTKKS